MRIREYRESDAAALAEIFVRAVTITGLRSYTPEQVAAWAAGDRSPEQTHRRCSDGRLVLVAVDDADRAVAFIDLLQDGLIDMLFCSPGDTGRGLASALYEQLEAIARARGIKTLHVEASEIARPFFARRGFTHVRRNDFEIGGVAIHNHLMEKQF